MNNYKLLSCQEPPYNGRVYYAQKKKRQWIPSGEHIAAYNFKWEDIEMVPREVISKYELAGSLPNPNTRYKEHISVLQMREFLSNKLSGHGVEFNAGSKPFPCPVTCDTIFAGAPGRLTPGLMNLDEPQSEDEVVINVKNTTFDKMEGIEDDSLNYIIAGNTIEYLPNPLSGIEKAWCKLKVGGKLILVVPHKDLTINSKRELTTLAHLILDYKRPLKERDFLHFVEFYEKAAPTGNPYELALKAFNNQSGTVHYHTWNEESFFNMIQYFSENIKKWSSIIFYSALKHHGGNEFYFLLEK